MFQYGIALLIILVVEITTGALASAYREKAEDTVRKLFKSTIKNYYTTADKRDFVTLFWDHMMVVVSMRSR